MNAVTAWSYSRFHKYDVCPLEFKLSAIDKIKEPGSPAMERGNAIHQGIAGYLQGKANTLPADAMQHGVMTKLIQEVHAFPIENKQVEQQWGYTAGWEATGWFSKDTWFRSVLDVGVMYDDLTYEAIDWKTGRKYGSNAEQMETQALAVMKRFKPVTHVTTRLAYLDSGEFEYAEFPASHQQKLADKWTAKVAPMFTDTVFAPRPSDRCRRCNFARSKMGKCAFG